MEYRVLGPLEVLDGGRSLQLGGGRQRALVALLLLHANEPLALEQLIDELWGAEPPATAVKTVQTYVARLRKLLPSGAIATRGGGYVLQVSSGELDLERFERLAEEGRQALAAGDASAAAKQLRAGLALWRGAPLAEFATEPFAQRERRRLEELRLAALEERIEADLALGHHSHLIGELEVLVDAEPYRERLRAQLMLALYRCGRQADALGAYQAASHKLREELGLEPSDRLRRLEQAILRQDASLEAPAPPVPEAAATMEKRLVWRSLAAAGVLMLGTLVAVGFALTRARSGGPQAEPNTIAVIDPSTNEVVDSVPVGVRPGAIAAAKGAVWAANVEDGTVSRIDPRRRELARTISIGRPATGLAADAEGVWATTTGRRIQRIDARFDVIRHTVPAAGLTDVMSFEPVPGVARGGGSLWVASGTGVVRLDATSGKRLDAFETGNNPSAVAFGAGAAWVTDALDNTVTRLHPTGAKQTMPVGSRPVAVAVGLGGVWVANNLDDNVIRIDPETRTVKAAIRVGRAPSGIALGNGSVWVANAGDGTVSRIDPNTNEVVHAIDVGGSPAGIAAAAGSIWVSVQDPLPSGRRTGGNALVALPSTPLGSLDPVFAFEDWSWELLYATCLKLMNLPDKPAPAGSVPVPEAASGPPTVRDGGRTWVFTIRQGFRFSPPSNEPVTARTFAHTIERATNPRMKAPWAAGYLSDVAGMKAYRAGKSSNLSGITTRGNTLTIRLVRPSLDLPARLAMPFFCAVPTDTPTTPGGVRTTPAAGPYYVASFVPGRRVVLRRNSRYRGSRPHMLDEIVYAIGVGQEKALEAVERGSVDLVRGIAGAAAERLRRRYGAGSPAATAGRQRFFLAPLQFVRYFALNTSRPLFSDARMRRAVNYAIDRRALARLGNPAASGAATFVPTDQYLSPAIAGFRDERIYPLDGPDVAKAKRLADGRRTTAVLYTCDTSPCPEQAEVLRQNLRAIGVRLEVRSFPLATMYAKQAEPNAPFDIGYSGWAPDYPDPAAVLNSLFAKGSAANLSRFDDPRWNGRLQAAALTRGAARYRAYGKLDIELARDAAPAAAWGIALRADFFSERIGCQLFHPIYGLDLAALCLRRD